MDDLISRSTLIAKAVPITDDPHVFRCVALEDVKNAPTIDAEPVRHGRWMPVTWENHPKIILGCTGYMCSECGRIEEENSEPYCHCGAKMDAKETIT